MRMILWGLAGLILAGASVANARTDLTQPLQEAGTLTCSISPGIGFILGSSRNATCIFDHPGAHYFSETYDARLMRVGIDVGLMTKLAIKWTVFTPGGDASPGMLAGIHTGSSSETTLIAGSGAQVAFAETGTPIVLRQLSSTMEIGLAVGFGQTSLELAAASVPAAQ